MELFAVLIGIAFLIWLLSHLPSQEDRSHTPTSKPVAPRPGSPQRTIQSASDRTSSSPELRQQEPTGSIASPPTPEQAQPQSPQRTRQPRRSSSASGGRFSPERQSLNTGIPELDGPGMWHRLVAQGPQSHVTYLLYSKEHEAYKVGIIEPLRLAERIQTIRQYVPDVVLAGTRVFTSRQNAFNAEQAVLRTYRSHAYRGIRGRYAGTTEWLSVKPSGRHNFMAPADVEERYAQQQAEPVPQLDIPDNYTVYLVQSKNSGKYRISWCASSGLPQKLRRMRREYPDAELVSRFKIESIPRARAIAISLNERAGSYRADGRRDVFSWCDNPSSSALAQFETWDENGNRR